MGAGAGARVGLVPEWGWELEVELGMKVEVELGPDYNRIDVAFRTYIQSSIITNVRIPNQCPSIVLMVALPKSR